MQIEVSDLVGVMNAKQLASVAALSTAEGAQLAGLPPPTPSAGCGDLIQMEGPAPPPISELFHTHPSRRRLRESAEEEPKTAPPAPAACASRSVSARRCANDSQNYTHEEMLLDFKS